ncbi:MAG TPA: chloride channel protein [Bdellovibrionota bacterium]|nr:chloride channel protein [Bdellovibrionota bacterium]
MAADREIEKSSTTQGLPVSPSLGPTVHAAHIHRHVPLVDRRVALISLLAMLLAVVASGVAQVLTRLIAVITHIAFYGELGWNPISPAENHLGYWVIGVPIAGSIIVGFMARYGAKAIRGHGIPEAMEQILLNDSKIPARMTWLKPVSAAVAIGTGGPFGAEGPIIATGGALGSLLGQVIKTTGMERKTLLAAGAAAGMTATFGSPVSAVLLAIELLLFEYRPRSLIPVALAATVAAGCRNAMGGGAPAFEMGPLTAPTGPALIYYLVLGAAIGVLAVVVTKAVYWIEDQFERLPIHWMWWPAVGALVVGVVGIIAPHTLGVGYDNIDRALSGNFVGTAAITFCLLKFVSWSIALGSGTSGGTLAPIFTIGGGFGAVLGGWSASLLPSAGIDPRVAALVGMAGTFAGASRALLASIVFAFETTRQPHGLLPLLGGCTVSYLISALLMKNTIMTEKLVRRGHHVPTEYEAASAGSSSASTERKSG